MASPSEEQTERSTAFGQHLIEIHDLLRDELDRLRNDVGSYLDGTGERPRDLRVHCLAFCSAITAHHTHEDRGMFQAITEHFPDLRPTVEKLIRDHEAVSGLVRGLEETLDGFDAESGKDTERIERELEGLSAILESHFRYEEKTLFTALNSLGEPR